MPRPIRLLAVGSAYVGFLLVGGLITHVLLPLALLGIRDPDARIAKGQALLHRWMRRFVAYMSVLRLMRLRAPELPERLAGGQPAVIVANHPSLLDVVMLLACVPRLTYVVKASWFDSVFIGPMLRRCGHIPGPDGATPAAGTITMQRMLEALERGRTVLVFPEGTRSPLGGLRPFSRGAFEAATRAGVPLVPCVIRVDPPVLGKGRPWHDVPNEVVMFDLRMLPPIPPDAHGASAKEIARELRRTYKRELGLEDPPVASAGGRRLPGPA
jgi:1-acyl-sn-glycerol-3-phosphate acyltransferase